MTDHVSDLVAIGPRDPLVRDGSFILGFPAFRVKDWEFQISRSLPTTFSTRAEDWSFKYRS